MPRQDVPSLTAPLNLRQFLKAPPTGLDPVPVLDLLLIGLFFALFNSQFILPPGLTIELPQAGARELAGVPVTAVVTLLPPPRRASPRPPDSSSSAVTSSGRRLWSPRYARTCSARRSAGTLCCWSRWTAVRR